jgi:hypothetical protein
MISGEILAPKKGSCTSKGTGHQVKFSSVRRIKQRKFSIYSPHDAITGSSGCLAMDLILPEHFPIKHPNNFPERK